MKIYDISQEVFGCQVYAGDPAPEKVLLSSMEEGELYNLTAFRMCAHNGTHIDAPFHFIQGGKAVDSIDLDTFVGLAYAILSFCRTIIFMVFPVLVLPQIFEMDGVWLSISAGELLSLAMSIYYFVKFRDMWRVSEPSVVSAGDAE